MSTIRITITSGEWHRAFHDVGHFCGDDEQTVAGQLLLTVADGTRTWSAGEPRCLATLACTAGPGPELETLLSPRLVGAACALTGDDDEAVDLVIDSEQPGMATVTSAHGTISLPVLDDELPGWSVLVDQARARAAVAVEVDRDAAWRIVSEARRAPAGADLERVNPPFWLSAGDGELVATVVWPGVGTCRYAVPATGAGHARVCITPRQLANLLGSAAPGTVTVSLPGVSDGPVVVTDTTGWAGCLKVADPVAEEELRPAWEATLADAFGDEAPVRDPAGDYVLPFGPVPVYARLVGGDSRRIQVYSVAATGLEASERLLAELNDQNSRIPFARAMLQGDRVVFGTDHRADGLDAEALVEACGRVAELSSQMGPLLAMTFGGRAAPGALGDGGDDGDD